MAPSTEPTHIDLKDSQRTFIIGWGDGAESRLPYRLLRQSCECALCIDELTGKRLLDPQSIPEDIGVADCSEVGAYGVRIVWTDGHSTGIYTFEKLRRMGDAATR
jgi:ATP-binding protein involved in chromosome partitioning